ncbi:helix-turn-helix domain-containing protein [Streptomyces sp. NRRL WC-3742]|uniref:helix-turn-helix domain-containing protein n=1 Tax=Streptomyces sp. NRRL WC-3742 TaxID=1463934 RepID=UPI0004C52AB6|nr:helix-turn-helix transcriptional regulator [Streptomyces sp. NRRL WC-3742]
MDQVETLRDFLMSRRARLRPEEVGLPVHGVRKVRGLRREEVAGLAAMSVEHYTRLERGRASCVSDGVLDAVADALRLSAGERRYLRTLARPSDAEDTGLPQERWRGLQSVLDSMALTPAYVVGAGGAILAWNRLATAVFLDFGRLSPEERTIGRLVFTDPRVRRLYVDWEGKARETVGLLRSEVGKRPRDAALAQEIAELREHSPEFRRLWSEHVVQEDRHATLQLLCPRAGGPLRLSVSVLNLADYPDLLIPVYTAEPDSDSERALHRLARTLVPAGA